MTNILSNEVIKSGGEKSFSKAASVALVIVSVLLGLALAQYIMSGRLPFGGGPVRNCIKSALGNLPDCNDGRGGDGTLKSTTVNGRSIGMCRNVTAAGGCIE